MTRACADDVDRIAASLPGAQLGTSWGEHPTWKVDGKAFLFYRPPHPTAADPENGEPYPDVLVVFMSDLGAKASLVQADGPFFDVDHFRGHNGVLVRLSRLPEIGLDELTEIITDAWAHRAPPRVARAYLGEPPDPFEGLSAPARRALERAGITTAQEAAATPDRDLLALHGFGPSALARLRSVPPGEPGGPAPG